MQAYRLFGQHDLRLQDEPDPDLKAGEVRLRMAYVGICGTDLHYYFAEDDALPSRPRHIGHELSATVAEAAPDVTSVSVGDRVAVFPLISCGECGECRAGHPISCERVDRSVSTVGCGGPIGGLAEHTVIPADLAVKLPDSVSLLQGALIEPLSVAATAVLRANTNRDGVALVTGAGLIGIGCALALRATGVSTVVVELSEERRKTLADIEGLTVLDPVSDDIDGIVRSMSGGSGADVVFECAGAAKAMDLAFSITRRRGRIVVIGLHERPYSMNALLVLAKELTIQGHSGESREAFEAVIDWMDRGLLPVDQWVTLVGYDRIVEDALEPSRRGRLIKAVIEVPRPR
ncbi:alcohol dehydrogenase catalytic domain-containing protein [Actinomadura rudentiformis]|uniref:Alcohol dehydrogenase catalytic domain-containing protein n=1 Tax=Actinomadura rudentiformis TaxID=359158 RepID=A0A6H9YNW4_9ACTN|nr:alcohol dehydrogenase catalytic domain-containing protein [Actinomadura rudentiformis]KAB2341590.1 alcohol dehydrogenase catalytic domain-containing protein [Actinomadura rudentiformis]